MATDRIKSIRVDRRAMARRFPLFLVPLTLIVSAIAAAIFSVQFHAAREVLRSEQQTHVALQCERIVGDLRLVVSDLLYLSENRSLLTLLDGQTSAKEALARDFVVFTRHKRIYDQVRYLDESGSEVVRVNYRDGRPLIIPEQQLQPKADRYYFPETICLQRGEVFVSPFDLNVEQGVVEQPLKPTIRFATPVFDRRGVKRGIVIVNYLGENLLERFRRRAARTLGHIMLLNREGYWLYAPEPGDQWGFMLPQRKDRTFAQTHADAWRIIANQHAGQFDTPNGLHTFQTVYPVPALPGNSPDSPDRPVRPDYYWKVVAHVSPAVLAADSRPLWRGFLQTLLLLTIIIAAGSAVAAKLMADRAASDAALLQAQQRMLQSERLAAIGEAMAGLAHESRNALQRSQACLEMLAKRVQEAPGALDMIQRLQCAQDDLYRLYERVRSYAAPIVLDRQPCDLCDLLRETWQSLATGSATLNESGTDVDTRCQVDALSVRQAFSNILDNALNLEDVENLHIEVAWSQIRQDGRDLVRVTIDDNGPGLNEQQRGRIFEPFYTTRTRGTGLGMAIAQRMIEAHGGEIAVGENDVGTRIVVTLPRG